MLCRNTFLILQFLYVHSFVNLNQSQLNCFLIEQKKLNSISTDIHKRFLPCFVALSDDHVRSRWMHKQTNQFWLSSSCLTLAGKNKTNSNLFVAKEISAVAVKHVWQEEQKHQEIKILVSHLMTEKKKKVWTKIK